MKDVQWSLLFTRNIENWICTTMGTPFILVVLCTFGEFDFWKCLFDEIPNAIFAENAAHINLLNITLLSKKYFLCSLVGKSVTLEEIINYYWN